VEKLAANFRRWYVDLNVLAAQVAPVQLQTPTVLSTPAARAAFDAAIRERAES
jgi:hypothetical protein